MICDQSYNLCEGGRGGFSYINRFGLNNKNRTLESKKLVAAKLSKYHKTKINEDSEWKTHLIEIGKTGRSKQREMYPNGLFYGKTHSTTTKQKISKAIKITSHGSNNSQYGTMWITNGNLSKKIKSTDIIPIGWFRGRIIKLKKIG